MKDPRKKLEIALFVILPFGTTHGCGKPSDGVPIAPAIEVRPKRVELGDATAAAQGAMPVAVRIMNRGVGALQIFSVQSSCGCTVVQLPLNRVEGGREEPLRVIVRTGAQPGPKSAILTIETNDPVSPVIQVPIAWRVVSRLTCEPGELDLGKLRPGQTGERRITVHNGLGAGEEDLRAQTATPALSLHWERPTGGANRERGGRVLVARLTADSDEGFHVGLVALTGESTGTATMIPVRWRVAQRLLVRPSALFASGVEPGADLTAQLVLQADENESFHVKSVTADGRPCSFALEDGSRASGPQSLQVNTRAPVVAGEHRLALRIETDLSGSLPVIVPWSMTVR